jgi:hypothetical protein
LEGRTIGIEDASTKYRIHDIVESFPLMERFGLGFPILYAHEIELTFDVIIEIRCQNNLSINDDKMAERKM